MRVRYCRLDWFKQLATAVAQAHEHDLLHGQLRAEHVLLGMDGDVKVLGFEPSSWRQIRRGAKRGELHALRAVGPLDAPELVGRTHASAAELAAADVWSLGVLLVALLVEEPPQLRGHVHEGGGVSLPDGMQEASPALMTLVTSMLQCDPAKRPAVDEIVEGAGMLICACRESLQLQHACRASSSLEALASTPMEKCESTTSLIATIPADGSPPRTSDDLSEAPTRASSLLQMLASQNQRALTSKIEALHEQLRMLQERPPLPQ